MFQKSFNITSVFLLLLAVTTGTSVYAGEYLGEFCWNATRSDGTPLYMKAGVTDLGGGHYLLTGTFGPSEYPQPLHGNAELIDGMIKINMNWIFATDTDFFYRLGVMSLDESLNGTLTGIMKQVNKETGNITRGRFEIPITFASCD